MTTGLTCGGRAGPRPGAFLMRPFWRCGGTDLPPLLVEDSRGRAPAWALQNWLARGSNSPRAASALATKFPRHPCVVGGFGSHFLNKETEAQTELKLA